MKYNFFTLYCRPHNSCHYFISTYVNYLKKQKKTQKREYLHALYKSPPRFRLSLPCLIIVHILEYQIYFSQNELLFLFIFLTVNGTQTTLQSPLSFINVSTLLEGIKPMLPPPATNARLIKTPVLWAITLKIMVWLSLGAITFDVWQLTRVLAELSTTIILDWQLQPVFVSVLWGNLVLVLMYQLQLLFPV